MEIVYVSDRIMDLIRPLSKALNEMHESGMRFEEKVKFMKM